MSDHDTRTVKGAGLARGPALVVGTILAVFGLVLFLHAGDTPTGRFPDGDATGSTFLGFESNGWTAWITTAAGVALLFGAAQHLLAKTTSLVVAIVLAACAVLALVDGPGVLGLAAANWAVELGWGVAAVLLLLNLLAPRLTREEPVVAERDRPHRDDRPRDAHDRRTHDRDAQPVAGDAGRHDGPHVGDAAAGDRATAEERARAEASGRTSAGGAPGTAAGSDPRTDPRGEGPDTPGDGATRIGR